MTMLAAFLPFLRFQLEERGEDRLETERGLVDRE